MYVIYHSAHPFPPVSRVSISSLSQPLDFDTVYRLLQDREKDLEVAARIGQTLLRRNEVLEAGLTSVLDSKQQCEQEVSGRFL